MSEKKIENDFQRIDKFIDIDVDNNGYENLIYLNDKEKLENGWVEDLNKVKNEKLRNFMLNYIVNYKIEFNKKRKIDNLTLSLQGDKLGNFTEFDLNLVFSALEKSGLSQSVISLEIVNGNLKVIPENIKNLVNLNYLDLSGNKIEDISKLGELKNLTVLDLSYNNIKDISSKLFDLINLNFLSLSNNFIQEISENIKNLVNLNYLDLSGNKIEDISKLGELKNLTVLDLSYNNIKNIPFNLFNLKNLTILSLSNNFIQEIPEGIKNLENLEHLLLYGNKIEKFPYVIITMKKLKFVDLGNNEIEKIEMKYDITENGLLITPKKIEKWLKAPFPYKNFSFNKFTTLNNNLIGKKGFSIYEFGFLGDNKQIEKLKRKILKLKKRVATKIDKFKDIDPLLEIWTLIYDYDKEEPTEEMKQKVDLAINLVKKINGNEITFGKKKIKVFFPKNLNVFAGLFKTVKNNWEKLKDKPIDKQISIVKEIYENNIKKYISRGKVFYKLDENGNIIKDSEGKPQLKNNIVIFLQNKPDGAFVAEYNEIINNYFENLGENVSYFYVINDFIFEKIFEGAQYEKIKNDIISGKISFVEMLESYLGKLDKNKNVILYIGGHGDEYGNLLVSLNNGENIFLNSKFFNQIININNKNLYLWLTSCDSGYKFNINKSNINLYSDSYHQSSIGGRRGVDYYFVEALKKDENGNFKGDFDGDGVVNPNEVNLYRLINYNESLMPTLFFDKDGNGIQIATNDKKYLAIDNLI